MIWILDNGEEYSDHGVYFVQTPDGFRMHDFLQAVLAYDPYFRYTASASAPDGWSWYDITPIPIEQFAKKAEGVAWKEFLP